VAQATIQRKKALAVVFLLAAGDVNVHFNSSRQRNIVPLAEAHLKAAILPKHFYAWAKVSAATRVYKASVYALSTLLIKFSLV